MADSIEQPQPRPTTPSTGEMICPYLLADGGAWRASTPARAHRCAAVAPPALLTTEKQRRLCLTAEHHGCATFMAARSLRPATDRADARGARPTARTIARTTPLVLDHGRLALSAPTTAWRLDRSIGQAALVVLMVLAFAAILVARLAGADGSGAGAVAGATGTPGPTPSVSASSSPIASTPSASGTPSTPSGGSPGPTASATATDTPSATDAPQPSAAGTTYLVRPGDTLSGIAARFGTTWQVIAELNGIDDARRIRAGQELLLP